MSFLLLIVLAIIQGLTEFLPISSSGHLVLLYDLFGIQNNTQLLSILLHIATLFSVVIYYRKEILTLIKKPLCPTNKKIFLTTIVTCIIVLFLKPIIDRSFNGEYLFVFFILTAIILFVSDYLSEKHIFLSRTKNFVPESIRSYDNFDITNIDVKYTHAIIIGITQAIACIPGISRSGSTIAIAKMCGVKDSARYSFLISIPIIIASFIMEIIDTRNVVINSNIWSLILAMLICFVIGLTCIKFMTELVKNNKLIYFSYYLIALSTILVVLSFIK